MSILGLLASSGWWMWICFVLGFVCLLWIVYELSRFGNHDGRPVATVVALVLTLVFAIGWFFSATHVMVPINQKALVIDRTTSTIQGPIRNSGLLDKPFLMARVMLFPAASNQEMCQEFTPSIKGGYEVKLKTCFYVEASKVDWVRQFSKYNKDYAGVWSAWVNQLSPLVATAVKDYEPQQLTSERSKVADAVRQATQPWFSEDGIIVNSVALPNWDFSNPAIGTQYDAAIVLQAQASARYNAAATDRATDLYLVETQKLVADKMPDVMRAYGISTEQGVLNYLYLQWLITGKSSTTVVVNPAGVPVVAPSK